MSEVLVVGGGPVGLTMACELMRHGLKCRIVDQSAGPQPWSKAAAIMPRTLEVLRNTGIADVLIEQGRPMYGFNLCQGPKRLAHVPIQLEGTPFPYLLGLSQRETELALAKHLTELGGRLEREVELVSFQEVEDGVRSTLKHVDGSHEEVFTQYLVGCDGARSTVRTKLGLSFTGSTFEQSLWQADARVRFPIETDPNEAYAFVSDAGYLVFLPLLAESRYRVIAIAPPRPEEEPTLEGMREIAKQRAPEGVELDDPAWIAAFRFHGRIVEHYRVGRVFLAGDAAHVHSPVGAQGMNLGIQDAVNLAWKLALTTHGAARPLLLDSYEPERRAIAEGIVQRTDRVTRTMMRMVALRNPLAAKLRSQLVSVVAEIGILQSQIIQTLGGMRVGYPDSPIVGEHHSSLWTAELGERRDERPAILDWMRFSDGPGPGQRVPDVDLPQGSDAATLHELLLGTKHTLLLFDGAAATPAGYANLSAIADRVERRYGTHIAIVVIVPATARPPQLTWKGRVLFDAEAELHGHFGCGSEGLYLIRPDGYVAFRSQPAVEDAIFRYLETIFVN